MRDVEQLALDAEDAIATCRALARCRQEYLTAKERVRCLEQQLRSAKNALKESHLKLAAAEIRLTKHYGSADEEGGKRLRKGR